MATIPVKNPFVEIPGFNCIACGPHHQHGLKLEFEQIDDAVVTRFAAAEDFSGIGGILHGGIQATILDEVMWWTVFQFKQRFCVTQNMHVEFKGTVKTGMKLAARGKIIGEAKNCVSTRGEIREKERVLVSAEATYFLPSQKLFARSQGIDPNTLPEVFRRYMTA